MAVDDAGHTAGAPQDAPQDGPEETPGKLPGGVPVDVPVVVPTRTTNGAVRMIARLPATDAVAYAAAVAPLARRIERSLSSGVMANRVRGRAVGPPSVELEPWRPARRRFSDAAAAAAARSPGLAIADVADCYGSIRDGVVERRLRSLGAGAEEVHRLRAVLEHVHAHGVRGLPVGPRPSAILANAVLGSVDESLARWGVRSLRWVDDVVIFAWDDRSALDALARLEDALAGIGLVFARSKTGLVARGASTRSLRLERLSRADALL